MDDPLDLLALQQLIPQDINERRKALRTALQLHVVPKVTSHVENATFPFELLGVLREQCIMGLECAGYGCPALSSLEKALVSYELGRVDAGLGTFYLVQLGLAVKSIELLGSESQKERYLKSLCEWTAIGCFALTEPDYGSDASGLQTVAVPTTGGYLISGTKKWIGNAPFADVLVTWAKNTATGQVEGFIVNGQAKGLQIKTIKQKLALRIVQNGVISYSEVFVSEGDRLEKARDFASGVNLVLASSRVFAPWLAVGMMAGVYENVIRHASMKEAPTLTRIVGGFNASFLLCWRLVQLQREARAPAAVSALVKGWVTRIGREVTAMGMDIMGSDGILIENYVMRALLDMEVVYTYEGTYDVNMLIAGRAVLGIPAIKPSYKL